MFVELGLFVVGIASLVFGANRAVTSAGDLALYYGVSPFFIGDAHLDRYVCPGDGHVGLRRLLRRR